MNFTNSFTIDVRNLKRLHQIISTLCLIKNTKTLENPPYHPRYDHLDTSLPTTRKDRLGLPDDKDKLLRQCVGGKCHSLIKISAGCP